MPFGGVNVFFFKLLSIAKEKKIKVLFNGDGADEIFGGYKKYRILKSLNDYNYFRFAPDGTQIFILILLVINLKNKMNLIIQ